MGIRMKYFPRDTGINHEQVAAMNAALINELEQDENPPQSLLQRIVPVNFLFRKPCSRI
jgi:hypothetical protein